MNIKDIDKRIERMLAGVRQAFRGVLGGVDSSGPVQIVQGEGLAGENLADIEYFQHYGYTSNPPADAMKIVVPVGGRTSHCVVIATEHGAYRLKALKTGEVALYTDEGDSIVLSRGRVIDITTKTLNIKAETEVNIDTPTVNVKHQLNVTEKLTGQGGLSMSGGDGAHIDTLNVDNDATIGGKSFLGHRHPETGSVTNTPI
jgi:phage baseplate assembly protein V